MPCPCPALLPTSSARPLPWTCWAELGEAPRPQAGPPGHRCFLWAGSACRAAGGRSSPGLLSQPPLRFPSPARACTSVSLGQEPDCCNPKKIVFSPSAQLNFWPQAGRGFGFPFPHFQKGPAETQCIFSYRTSLKIGEIANMLQKPDFKKRKKTGPLNFQPHQIQLERVYQLRFTLQMQLTSWSEGRLHTALLSNPVQPISKILLLVQNSMLLRTRLLVLGSATLYLMGIRNV